MNITIQMPDECVAQLLASNRVVKGSIRLVNPTTGNFRPYAPSRSKDDASRVEYPLKCGKAVKTDEQYELHLRIKRRYTEFPKLVIMDDCSEAAEFFES